MQISFSELHELLERKYVQYNSPSFIGTDPISIPHRFRKKEDKEISGFLAATIAWGQRPVIIRNAEKMMSLMNDSPYEYLMNQGFRENKKEILKFCHRTFNGQDLLYFFKALSEIYRNHGGLENCFSSSETMEETIDRFRSLFLSFRPEDRIRKHISSPATGSATKRINMYLRWMVRSDDHGVDFGLWKKISPESLYLPLDVHSGNVARKLGLLKRSANDWKAVAEVTESLRKHDKKDPVKYDFALFGLGIFENF